MAKSDPIVRKCRNFFCRKDGKPRCCADCQEECGDRCQNDPLKCRLVDGIAHDPGVKRPKRTPDIDETLAYELWQQGLTDEEIGEAMGGLHRNTIYNWRKRMGLGHSRKRGTIL